MIGTLTPTQGLSGSLSPTNGLDGELSALEYHPTYDGPAVYIPMETGQTIRTAGKVMETDITILQVPSNWGRIEHIGDILIVR